MDALLGELFQEISPAALTWYRDRSGIAQKLLRLDMLLIKICSAVEVSEKVKINSESLSKWQQKLKDAATQGDEILRKHRDQIKSSSPSQSSICAFFFRAFFARWSSPRKKEAEEVRRTVESLEQISAEVKDFIEKLKLKLLPEQRRKMKCGANSLKIDEEGPMISMLSLKPIHLLSNSKREEVDAVQGLTARLQSAVDEAAQKEEEDGSWLG